LIRKGKKFLVEKLKICFVTTAHKLHHKWHVWTGFSSLPKVKSQSQ